MKRLISVIIILAFLLMTGCSNYAVNTVVPTATPTKEPENLNKKIYDSALNYAIEGEFTKAVAKLKELSEPYSNSDELIALLSKPVSSPFIGTWYCSRNNSCNDMEITLSIYPVYRLGVGIMLAFERDMGSGGSGSSNIEGVIELPTSYSTTVNNLNMAKWSISGNTLKEVFPYHDNRTNTYTKR